MDKVQKYTSFNTITLSSESYRNYMMIIIIIIIIIIILQSCARSND
jgi:hypothetical protein